MGCTCSNHKPVPYSWEPEEGMPFTDDQYWSVLENVRLDILDKLEIYNDANVFDMNIVKEWIHVTKQRDILFRKMFSKEMEQYFIMQLHHLQCLLTDTVNNIPMAEGGLIPEEVKRELVCLKRNLSKVMETDDVKQELFKHNCGEEEAGGEGEDVFPGNSRVTEWQKKNRSMQPEESGCVTEMARNYKYRAPPQLNDSTNLEDLLNLEHPLRVSNHGRSTPDSLISFESALTSTTQSQISGNGYGNRLMSNMLVSNRMLLAGQIAGFAADNQQDVD